MSKYIFTDQRSLLPRLLYREGFQQCEFKWDNLLAFVTLLIYTKNYYIPDNPSLLNIKGELREALGVSKILIDNLNSLLEDFTILLSDELSVGSLIGVREIWTCLTVPKSGYFFKAERYMVAEVNRVLETPIDRKKLVLPSPLFTLIQRFLPAETHHLRQIFLAVHNYISDLSIMHPRIVDYGDHNILNLGNLTIGNILGVSRLHKAQLASLILDVISPEPTPRIIRSPVAVREEYLHCMCGQSEVLRAWRRLEGPTIPMNFARMTPVTLDRRVSIEMGNGARNEVLDLSVPINIEQN